jgi:uroporphyrinogen decarboxylase
VTFWSEWVVDRPFDDVRGAQSFLKKLIIDVQNSDPQTIWSYAGPGGIVGQEVDNYASYFDRLKKEVFPTVPCHIESPIGLDVIYNMVGWELFSYLLVDDPGLVSEAFEALNRHEERRVHLVADPEISPLVIVYCDIASKQDVIMSPTYLRKEFFPRLRRLVDAWHEHGVKVIFHSEGNIKKVMDDLIGCEVDGINPLEPENISLEYVRRHYPKLVLWGGIDDKQLLPFGSIDEVEEAVKKAIDVCSAGGLILGSSGEIHPEVKPHNAIALFRTAKSYSRR